jgi:hypothetical protein
MATKTQVINNESFENNYQEFMLSMKAKSNAQRRETEEDLLASLEARE